MSAVDEGFVFGRKNLVEQLSAVDAFHDFGVLTNEEWQYTGLSSPIIIKQDKGFTVIRLLFNPREDGTWRTNKAHWVAEIVSTDGEIVRENIGDLTLSGISLSLVPEI